MTLDFLSGVFQRIRIFFSTRDFDLIIIISKYKIIISNEMKLKIRKQIWKIR